MKLNLIPILLIAIVILVGILFYQSRPIVVKEIIREDPNLLPYSSYWYPNYWEYGRPHPFYYGSGGSGGYSGSAVIHSGSSHRGHSESSHRGHGGGGGHY